MPEFWFLFKISLDKINICYAPKYDLADEFCLEKTGNILSNYLVGFAYLRVNQDIFILQMSTSFCVQMSV